MPRVSCLTGRGVIALFTVPTGFMTFRTLRGVAFRTLLRTTRFANPTAPPQLDRTFDSMTPTCPDVRRSARFVKRRRAAGRQTPRPACL